MSKLGRYSADRKKIQDVDTTNATITVDVADCGTIFVLKNSATAITMNMPSASKAGKGWWCKWVALQVGGSGDVTIALNSDDLNTGFGTVLSGANKAPGGVLVHSGSDGWKFDVSACAVGDQLEVFTDGTNWYGQSQTSGAVAILPYNA